MYAWAVLLASQKWNRIFCLFAETEEEAIGKAFSQLSKAISKDKEDKGKTSDYHLVVLDSASLPSQSTNGMPPHNSSFDDQIKAARVN